MGRSSESGSGNHHLPEEIVEVILVKLPVKSIIRFQSVSKSYFNLIKSSRFINKHLIENEESFFAMCLVVRNTNKWPEDSAHVDRLFLSFCSYDEHKETSDTWPVLNFEIPVSRSRRSDIYLVDQINGIMCLTNYDIIMLINPSLAEVKLLPIPVVGHEYFELIGFGFDDTTMDFKVVRVTALHSGRVVRVWGDVYSLRSKSWRKSDDELPFVVYDSTDCSTFFNGVVHWCVAAGIEGESFSWRILTFNLATELFQQMEYPLGGCTNIGQTAPRLFVLNQESLGFVSYKYCSQSVDVWTMNKQGTEETWTKLYSVGPLTHFSKPISFLKNDKFFYTANFAELILYDRLNHRSSVVCDYRSEIPRDDSNFFPLCLEMGVCKSSLVSLNM